MAIRVNLLVYIILTIQYYVKSYLIGIDLGTQFFKMNLLKPKSPFTMVENVQSKTKTPLNLILKDEERLYGADALNKKPRFPNLVFSHMHEFLGKSFGDEEVEKFMEKYFFKADYVEDKDRHSFSFKVNFDNKELTFSVEEIFAMFFRYIKVLTATFADYEVKDCVVSVPAFYGYKERQALVQATQMSGLNLIAFINENSAAALYAAAESKIDTSQDENLQNVIFYNVGASYTQATLVRYRKSIDTSGSFNITTNNIDVLAETWDSDLGGRNFDYGISKHLLEVFDNSSNVKVKGDYRALERILPNAIKYKEILSANKNVMVSILGVSQNTNLKTELTKDTFESLFEDEFSRVLKPIDNLLDASGLTLDDIVQVEILGGGVRIPKIQSILGEKLGKKLGQHMNGDDSMAYGAAMYAANFSAGYRARQKTFFSHGPNFDIYVEIKTPGINPNLNYTSLPICSERISPKETNITSFALNCVREIEKNTVIFLRQQQHIQNKKLNFRHDGDFEIDVFERFPNKQRLLMTFKSKGVRDLVAKINNSTEIPRVVLNFNLDSSGMLNLKAELHYGSYLYLAAKNTTHHIPGQPDFFYQEEPVKPYTEEELETFSKNNQTEYKHIRMMVGNTFHQYVRKNIETTIHHANPIPLTQQNILDGIEKLNKLDEFDKKRVQVFEKKNTLESLIYEKKDWLESSTERKNVIDEVEYDTLVEVMKINSEWFENHSNDASLGQLISQISNITNAFGIVEERKGVSRNRTIEGERLLKEINFTKTKATKLVKARPWLQNYYTKNFTVELSHFNDWYKQMTLKQKKIPLYKDPILTPQKINQKIKEIQSLFSHMQKIKKPRTKLTEDTLKIEEFLDPAKSLEDLMKPDTKPDEEELNRKNDRKSTKD